MSHRWPPYKEYSDDPQKFNKHREKAIVVNAIVNEQFEERRGEGENGDAKNLQAQQGKTGGKPGLRERPGAGAGAVPQPPPETRKP